MSTSEHESDAEGNAPTRSLGELPPSSKLVYKVLEYEGQLTQEEIARESRLCARTVRYALGKLDDEGLVASRVCLDDARQSKYWIEK
ncbi:MarR family transcriptional regulator [Halosolutus halophilus]|uniref:MarR family transcriptional regulator n=1 Tax=Halosolutus halophilus TaxID=1552990 RepID=UPI00223516AA|nr:MarR family transcriptional regulator [Halosolutus halophilus]